MSSTERELTDFKYELSIFVKKNFRISMIIQCIVKWKILPVFNDFFIYAAPGENQLFTKECNLSETN